MPVHKSTGFVDENCRFYKQNWTKSTIYIYLPPPYLYILRKWASCREAFAPKTNSALNARVGFFLGLIYTQAQKGGLQAFNLLDITGAD